ncbi:MAG: NADH-quinone oxidoreductase subunit NuoH [Pirellulales bacterium]
MPHAILEAIVKIALLIGGMMTAAAYFVLLERWMAAWIQDRKGPNRVGIPLTNIKMFGLGQPLADGLKFIFKEEYTPKHVDKFLYLLAPISILAAALATFAAVPFGSVIPAPGVFGFDKPISLLVAPGLDVSVIYVFALSSIAVYGVILGGWASNNKYSFLGGLRSSAQLIAYEIPLGLGLLGVVLSAGTLRLDTIITAQATTGLWNVFAQPLGFIVFFTAAFAEAARLPFDLPECEQELIGGYHTEYAGLKLLLFLVAEFLHMITASFLITILFLGGWHFWGITGSSDEIGWITAILRIVVLSVKVFFVIVFFMIVRWSWPRFRFDQLMDLAWKVMLPLGLLNFAAVAVLLEFGDQVQASTGLDSRLLLVAGGWAVLAAGWVYTAVASPFQTDNRPRVLPAELAESTRLRGLPR